MARILKYFKPFVFTLALSIVLLYLQANAELALPDYMSRIVNVGIQQGGVERAVPQAMRASTAERLQLLVSSQEAQEIFEYYELIDSSSPKYALFLDEYPVLATQPILVLRSDRLVPYDRLEALLSKPLVIVSAFERLAQDPQWAAELLPDLGLGLLRLPSGVDPFDLLAQLPAQQRLALLPLIEERFAAIGGERAILLAAARAVRGEYEALGMDMAGVQNAYILRVGGQMALIALVAAIATIAVGLLSARIAAGLARNLRGMLFAHVMNFSGAEFSRFSTASLITRSTNDITQIQTVTAIMVRMVFFAPIIGVGAVVRALDKSPTMWWTIALAVLLLLCLIASVFIIAVPKFKIIQRLTDRLNLVARENLVGMMVVRAFNRQAYEEGRFDRANRELTATSLFINRVFVIVMPLMMLIMNGATILILWVGAEQVAQASMQVGDMIAFMQYAIQVVFAFLMLSMLFILFPRADVSAHRVADVLETPITILDPAQPKPFPQPFVPIIEFDSVSFRYPGAEENVLQDLSFRIEAGQTVGIMGTTGSGKSTVVNLIPRFFDVTAGQIRLSGVDIRQVALRDLRSRIGYVPQQSNLFAGTVAANLRFAKDEASDDELRAALAIAQADFILKSPQGLETGVSQGGANFSGGQRQRLTIARALVRRAPIYIFDDSFSALDYRTDARLRRALSRELKHSTVLIVSQRVATIKNADKILVFDQGRLIGQGTHAELVETCQVYREIARSQLRLEAAA